MTRFQRIPVLLLTAATLCAALSTGCAGRIEPSSTKPKKDPSRMTPSELQQFVSTQAALAGANAGIEMTQLPTAPLPPAVQVSPPGVTPAIVAPQFATPSTGRTVVISRTSGPEARRNVPPSVRFANVTSAAPYETENDARTDALKVAAHMIMEKLQQLDPPIVTNVKPNRVWNEYVVQSTAQAIPLTPEEKEALKDSRAGANRVRYQFDVEISEPQLRELRAEGRIKNFAAPIAFGGLILAMVATGLLRLTGAAAAAVRRA